jgi:hypothetical protein
MRSQAQARTHSSPEPPRCRAAQLLVQQAPLHIERLILLDAVLLETGESFALNHIGWPAQVRRPRRRSLCNVSAVLGQPASCRPTRPRALKRVTMSLLRSVGRRVWRPGRCRSQLGSEASHVCMHFALLLHAGRLPPTASTVWSPGRSAWASQRVVSALAVNVSLR